MNRHSSDVVGIAGRCGGVQLHGILPSGHLFEIDGLFHARVYTFWHKGAALRVPMSALSNRCVCFKGRCSIDSSSQDR